MQPFTTFEQQKWLVEGYCKHNYEHSIPIMLIKLILSMYNEIFYWKLKGNQLNHLLSSRSNERVLSKPFKMKGIKFSYFVYSNISTSTVQLGACVLEMDRNIDYIVSTHTIWCIESNQWETGSSRCSKCTDAFDLDLAKISYFQKMKEINIYSKAEIIHIQPKDINTHKSLLYHKPGITMSKKTNFIWNVDDKLITKIKSESANECYRKWYHSKKFDNNNWWLELYQYRMYNQQKYFFGFKLLQFPNNIKDIKFKYSIVFRQNGKVVWESNKTNKRNYDNIQIVTGKVLVFDKAFISNTISFDASINIEIIELYDMNGNEIQPTNWDKYDIF